MRINLSIEVDECPYWNYENHTRTHDCHSCHCYSEGNSLENAHCGVMIDGNRYCTLQCDIFAELVNVLK